VPTETETTKVNSENIANLRLAPSYHKAYVKNFDEELADASDDIEIIENTNLWTHIFPDREPDAEATLAELTNPVTLKLISGLNVRSLIILNPPISSSEEDNLLFLGAAWHDSKAHSTKMSALILDLENIQDPEQLMTSAKGKSRAAWAFIPLPVINFFFWDFEADTEDSANAGLAKAFANRVVAKSDQRPVRIAVLGAVAESGMQDAYDKTHAKDGMRNTTSTVLGLSSEQLEWKASLGDPEAQLQLYWSLNLPERLIWLCRSADQEKAEAQKRLGILYAKGAEGVTVDPTWAFVWYSKASSNGDHWAGVDAERLLSGLNEKDAALAWRKLQAWEPGQCKLDLEPIWTTNIAPTDNDHDAISTPR